MPPIKTGARGWLPGAGTTQDDSGKDGTVVILPTDKNNLSFDQLTARLVLAQHRAGTLDPAILSALLAGVGLRP